MEAIELVNGKDYIIKLSPEELDFGIQYCEEFFRKLRSRYPESFFMAFFDGMTIEELTLEDIKKMIRELNEVKKKKEKEEKNIKKEEQ